MKKSLLIFCAVFLLFDQSFAGLLGCLSDCYDDLEDCLGIAEATYALCTMVREESQCRSDYRWDMVKCFLIFSDCVIDCAWPFRAGA